MGGVCSKLRPWRHSKKPWLLAVEDPQEMGKDIGSGSFQIRGEARAGLIAGHRVPGGLGPSGAWSLRPCPVLLAWVQAVAGVQCLQCGGVAGGCARTNPACPPAYPPPAAIKECFAEAAELLAEVCEDLDANQAAEAAATAAEGVGGAAQPPAAVQQQQEGGGRRQTLLAGVLDVEAAVGRSAEAER